MDPCATIPYFAGTQIVDGDESDLCELPSFSVDFVSANGFVHIDHSGSNDPSNERPETATVRLGWSATGLHAFIRVSDPYLAPASTLGSIWNGDGVEVFFTTATDLAGDPATDQATHAAISASLSLAASVSTDGGTATHAPLPRSLYETVITADGYVVELRLPWGSGRPSSGSTIAFDFALNSADNAPPPTGDGRDAQALLHLAGLSTSTTCLAEARPWCDDRTWCRPTLE